MLSRFKNIFSDYTLGQHEDIGIIVDLKKYIQSGFGDINVILGIKNDAYKALLISIVLNYTDDPPSVSSLLESLFAELAYKSNKKEDCSVFLNTFLYNLEDSGIKIIRDGGRINALLFLFWRSLSSEYWQTVDLFSFASFVIKLNKIEGEEGGYDYENLFGDILGKIVDIDMKDTLNLITLLLDCENIGEIRGFISRYLNNLDVKNEFGGLNEANDKNMIVKKYNLFAEILYKTICRKSLKGSIGTFFRNCIECFFDREAFSYVVIIEGLYDFKMNIFDYYMIIILSLTLLEHNFTQNDFYRTVFNWIGTKIFEFSYSHLSLVISFAILILYTFPASTIQDFFGCENSFHIFYLKIIARAFDDEPNFHEEIQFIIGRLGPSISLNTIEECGEFTSMLDRAEYEGLDGDDEIYTYFNLVHNELWRENENIQLS